MSTLLTSAGTVDRSAVMRRAWGLMRVSYGFGHVRFASIGRACFAWCLRMAWAEARDEIRRRAIPIEAKAGRIAELRDDLARLAYIDDWRHVDRRTSEIEDEIRRLAA